MRALARLSGDVDELVAVESKHLSQPRSYLRIAEIYHEAGDADKTLEWAEEGMWVFPDEKHSGLRGFVAEQYHERGRYEEAMEIAWEQFTEHPDLEGYQRLKTHADRAGGWGAWREKALQRGLPGGLRAAAQGTPSDAEAGSRAGVRRVSGAAPCRVQTQAQLHEAPQQDGIRTSTFVARSRRCTRFPGST
jgi:uncharacterized Zn finger protein